MVVIVIWIINIVYTMIYNLHIDFELTQIDLFASSWTKFVQVITNCIKNNLLYKS